MSRRTILIVALALLGVLVAIIAPWTVTTGGLAAAVAGQLRSVYGLDMTVAGRSTIALLPVPRVKFENVAFSAGGPDPIVRAEILRGEFRLLPLLTGRIELSEVALSGASIQIELDDGGRSGWDRVATALLGRVAGRRPANQHVRRFILANAALSYRDQRSGFQTRVSDVNAVVNWPASDRPLDLSTHGQWRGERVEVTAAGLWPSALLAGQRNQFTAEVVAPSAHLSLSGDAVLGAEPRLTGRAGLAMRSIREFATWSGVPLPLGTMALKASLDGDFAASRGVVSWPAARLVADGDRLDGALQARIEGGRLSFTGTLAADRLTLPDPFREGPFTAWQGDGSPLAGLMGADLDLRFSAREARFGGAKLEDVAANLIVRAGRIETSLNRATLNRGTVKGRLGISLMPTGFDLKAQTSFDRLDLGAFVSDIGQGRWISGLAQGQIVLDATGEDASSDLLRHANGRATITVRNGELAGIGFNEALRRAERRPLSMPLEWRGGRTSFDYAQVVLNVTRGVGEIAEGQVTAPGLRAALQGRVSLLERSLALKAMVEGQPATAAGSPEGRRSRRFSSTSPAPGMVPRCCPTRAR
jgi:AsmA protein